MTAESSAREQSAQGGASTPKRSAPPSTATILPLERGWDAALTYDVLEPWDSHDAASRDQPVFVGREDLLGSLVNAISQPDRRGTYLVSGYRGAGKTSLVIEAARRAVPRLEASKRSLLPLVLNVSEVSASLEPASDAKMPPLGIDARRLLTALLRALRNSLVPPVIDARTPESRELLELVTRAYDKAEASQYAERAQRRAEASTAEVKESKRSFEVANLLKLFAALAALAAVAMEGVAVFGASTAALQIACAALAGMAIISYRSSTTTSSEASQLSVADTELVFDNSLHQVESDLKDILGGLARRRIRTVFVLEELDKVEDKKGEQLDAVIRYFKNLFTQAPALFFFLTDKGYFDIIDDKIARARHHRSYAVEHTFFTHRVFVSRPSLDECLDYFDAVLMTKKAHAAVQLIRETSGARVRPVDKMTAVERFLRVLLLESQNHLFDLKNEMRGYVRVDEPGSRLEFDEESLPAQEQALAAFQFLLEQKARLYRFGGGRDYANEILRNCLSTVFADLRADAPQSVDDLYPEQGGPDTQLRLAERTRIAEAVDSLLSDLDRGGAIDTEVQAEGGTSFRWRANAVVVFSPVPKLETHEEALQEQLLRASRVCRQFGERGPLRTVSPNAARADALTAAHAATIEEIRRATQPLSVEDADRRSGQVVREVAPLLTAVRGLHQARLRHLGWRLDPIAARSEGNLVLVTAHGESDPTQILLVYGTDEEEQGLAARALAATAQERVVVLLVEEDPDMTEETRYSVLARWRAAIVGAEGVPSLVMVTLVKLGEDLPAPDVETTWGKRTSDELILARLWLAEHRQMTGVEDPTTIPAARPAWLARSAGTEQRHDSLTGAVTSWLTGGDPLLAAPPEAGNDPELLVRSFLEASTTSGRPRLLYAHTLTAGISTALPEGADPGEVERGLVESGRLIQLDSVIYPLYVPVIGGRAVLMHTAIGAGFSHLKLSTLRSTDTPEAFRALAAFVEDNDGSRATSLYLAAAEAGDAEAMALLVGRKSGDPQFSQQWADRLVATGAWDAVKRAAAGLGDSKLAVRLLEAAAEAGDAEAMALLVGRKSGDPQFSQQWADRLVATGAWDAVKRAAAGLGDSKLAVRLLEAAAEAGDAEAMALLVGRKSGDPQFSQQWADRLVATGAWDAVKRAAAGLGDSKLAVRLLEAAAEAGDAEAMALLVGRKSGDPQFSQQWADRLVATGAWDAVKRAAAGLGDSKLAVRLLEAAAEAGDAEAMALLVLNFSATDSAVLQRWEERLIADGDPNDLRRVAVHLDDAEPARALRFHRAAADAGDHDSMLEVLVRCASSDPEASRVNQERLAQSKDWERLNDAADRLRPENPPRAAEIDVLLSDAG